MNANIVMTDTFSGEANYSWKREHDIKMGDNSSDLSIIRKAKKLLNVSGIKCKKYVYDNMIELRPMGYNIVIFIEITE